MEDRANSIDDYVITETALRSAEGIIYRAVEKSSGTKVLLKKYYPSLDWSEEVLNEFFNLSSYLRFIEHDCLLPVLDVGKAEGKPYVVFADPGLTFLCDRKPAGTSQAEILEFLSSLAEGLDFLHKQEIVHGNLTPENLALDPDGYPLLFDFGLSGVFKKLLLENMDEGFENLSIGDVKCISSEQALNTQSLDEGTDIYSFGVMMYEMVTGCLPFNADTVFSVIEAHIHESPPLPRSVKTDLPEEVEQVILKALAKQRSDRYAKVADLVNAFKKAWLPDRGQGDISSTTMESLGIASLLAENGKSFPVAEGTVILGRNGSSLNIRNDIDLTSLDTKKIASRRHAMIQRNENEFILQDLESRNGTFVNGERLSPAQPHTLASGDVIEFGSGGARLTFTR